MGKKGSWFSSVKKALSPNSKEKKDGKSKKKWFGKEKQPLPDSSTLVVASVSPPQPIPQVEEVKLAEVEEEQTKHVYSVAVATAAAAEAAVAAAQAAAEVVRLTTVNQFPGKSKEEIAAIRIQTTFRGYLARRALRALRGLVRLKTLVDGPTVKRQTASTLKCMQTLSRAQSQISSRRSRLLEENRTLQRQLMQKHAKELESLRRGEEWDDTLQSKEQIEASLLGRYEAAMRRERALAYSYSHQQTWKKSSKATNLLFMDPTNPQWGWSWLERWMGARSRENQNMSEKELKGDQMSVRSASMSMSGGEITKAFARHQLNSELPSSPLSQKPNRPKNHLSVFSQTHTERGKMAEIEKQNKEKEKVVAETTVQIDQEGLPKTIVRRLVKEKLSQLSTDTDISLLRDSLLAFSESARIFIHYLSATANDICKESKRQTINAEDVFKALEEIEFPELIEPLKASLEGFREKNSKRKSTSSKSPESNKKAKLKEPVENGKGKMKEQPSDNENEDAQAEEEVNEVEDSVDD